MRHRRLWLLSIVALVLLAAVPSQAQAAFPGGNGKIAFVSYRDGNFEIYVMNPDGSGAQRLTYDPATDIDPTWSPFGTRIAFESLRAGGNNIYVMNADGTDPTELTFDGDSSYPAWSPDGTRIAFYSGQTGAGDIYVMNDDGSGQTRLTTHGALEIQPAWSPDGRIAFLRNQPGGQYDLYVMNANGTNQTRLTDTPTAAEYAPDWSPDGAKIVFYRNENGDSWIHTMNSDGTGDTNVGVRGVGPVWSPDGTKIAFHGYPGNGEVYVMNPDGTGATNIMPDANRPDWQPIAPAVLTGYPRPKGATPLRISLVPAYVKCSVGNRTHGGPLAYPSCSPPVQWSHQATVGTPDANGQPSKSIGSVRMNVTAGDPQRSADEADLGLLATVTDVREKADLSDYTGELQVTAAVRITDRDNSGPSWADAATVPDVSFSFTVPCVVTADTTVGATCAASTTADVLVPNTIREGKRAIWEFGQVQVTDGGEDGLASTTTDNTLFMKQGILIP